MKNSIKEKTFEQILNNGRKTRFFIIITILVCNT